MKKNYVANPVIARMPRYYRCVKNLHEQGVMRISSSALAELLNLTASQVRQDFGCFGEFGQKGYGYHVDTLLSELADILGLSQQSSAILVGCGNLGRALLNNFDFKFCGMTLVGAFDADPKLVGETINDHTVRDVSELPAFMDENHPLLAVLTLPSDQSAAVAKQLAELGIRGIWNFTQQEVTLDDPSIVVENVILTDALMSLSYRIHEAMQQ